jgi:hypothetical protein
VSNAAIEALETAAFAYPGSFEAVLSDGFVRNLSCLSVGKMDCEAEMRLQAQADRLAKTA